MLNRLRDGFKLMDRGHDLTLTASMLLKTDNQIDNDTLDKIKTILERINDNLALLEEIIEELEEWSPQGLLFFTNFLVLIQH